MKRGCWLRKGPSPPRGLAHPSGGRPVRTRVVAHPCATCANPRGDDVPAGVGVVAWIEAAEATARLWAAALRDHDRTGRRCPRTITTRVLPHRHRRCRRPRRTKPRPSRSPRTSSCRMGVRAAMDGCGREVRHGCRSERRTPMRQDGGPLRSRAPELRSRFIAFWLARFLAFSLQPCRNRRGSPRHFTPIAHTVPAVGSRAATRPPPAP